MFKNQKSKTVSVDRNLRKYDNPEKRPSREEINIGRCFEMKSKNGRLMLKIKKRRDSCPLTEKTDDKALLNQENMIIKDSIKRTNPFSKNNERSRKIQKIKSNSDSSIEQKEFFFSKLLSSSPKEIRNKSLLNIPLNKYGNHIFEELVPDPTQDNRDKETENYVYSNDCFPLDWSIKHRVRIISKTPFAKCMNIKSTNISKSVVDFARNDYTSVQFSSLLTYWIHPKVPGMSNFPLRNKTVKELKDNKCISLTENRQFQDMLLQDWKTSFQSLFNMLKTGYCSYFYLCSYQFCALFKASFIHEKSMSVTVTPTTKGFREMLLEEGVSFDMPYQKDVINNEEKTQISDEIKVDLDVSLNDSNNDEFLQSIGLNKQQHFPSIQEQHRLKMKQNLQKVDKHPESTIFIKNCHGFFNFLLNATFLCSPSGSMIGIPPTLISPTVFEGATLSKCKFTHGPVNHQNGSVTQLVYCTDISGFILPTQLKQIVDLLVDENHQDSVIQTKSFEHLQPLNIPTHSVLSSLDEDTHQRFGMPLSVCDFLNQPCYGLPDTCDIHFQSGEFKY